MQEVEGKLQLLEPEKLVKKTVSLCPKCLKRINAVIVERNNKLYIKKKCEEHGEFEDLYWSDYELYKFYMNWDVVGDGVENPRTRTVEGCPYDCGLCPNHKSHTVLGIIDVTNRCNLACPICFANAARTGYVYEPGLDEIRKIMVNFRENRPVKTVALQLSGGEPTVREDLPEIIGMAKELGFSHVEVNTNGLKFAEDIDFYRECFKAGMSTVYLQFDSLRPEIYEKLRGRNILPQKLKMIENAREIGHGSIVLVVTLAKGVNDGDMGDIIKFSAENSDVIRCINVQPISFSGAAKKEELRRMRITIPDFVKIVEEQTNGQIKAEDFRPVPWAVSTAKAVGAIQGKRYQEFTAHPLCGAATFFIPKENGEIVPINRYAEVDKYDKLMWEVYETAKQGRKTMAKLKMMKTVLYIKKGLLRNLILGILRKGTYSALGKMMTKMVMIGAMHFMDAWNYDLQRVERCVIHYGTMDGRIIPFCTFNTLHREPYERKYSVPLKEWRKSKGTGRKVNCY